MNLDDPLDLAGLGCVLLMLSFLLFSCVHVPSHQPPESGQAERSEAQKPQTPWEEAP